MHKILFATFQLIRRRVFCVNCYCVWFLICLALATPVNAAGPQVTYGSFSEVLTMFTKVYRPTYGYEARSKRMRGTGVYRMYINEKGVVTKIGVMKSTGHKLLDRDAAAALILWQTKPGRRLEVDMPVTFTLN